MTKVSNLLEGKIRHYKHAVNFVCNAVYIPNEVQSFILHVLTNYRQTMRCPSLSLESHFLVVIIRKLCSVLARHDIYTCSWYALLDFLSTNL